MKFRSAVPSVVAAAMATFAALLFIHTAVSRRERAESRRNVETYSHPESESDRQSRSGSTRDRSPAKSREDYIAAKVRAALAKGLPYERTGALIALMREFSSEDFPELLKACAAISSAKSGTEYLLILGEWVMRDPKAALLFCGGDRSPSDRKWINEIHYVIRSWALNDPDAACRWILNEGPTAQRDAYLKTAIVAISRRDISRSLVLIDEMEQSQRGLVIQELMSFRTPETTAAIAQWANEHEDPALRKGLVSVVLGQWFPPEPQAMFELLKENPEVMNEELLVTIFRSWASKNADMAIAALNDIEAGPHLSQAIQGVVSGFYLEQRPSDAAALLERYADFIDDATLRGISASAGLHYPAEGVELASRILNPIRRERAINSALFSLALKEPDAARSWVKTHELSAAARAEFEASFGGKEDAGK